MACAIGSRGQFVRARGLAPWGGGLERYGDFELIRLIATGGMAEIYLGQQASMGGFARHVVVKRMLPQLAVRADFVQMFLDEAKLAANLNHPNIVAVTNLGEVDSSYFIAMELVDGPHLGALFAHSLRLRKPLPVDLCCYIVARAADGLHYAHEQVDPASGKPFNLVHRDISPQNILVSRAGEVKVTDFGVAKASTHQTKTRTGIIKGKVAYMSPEQCLGEVVDRRTDVFALGIVLYELLTRRRLFREKSDLLIMQKITGEDVASASSVNKEIDAELDAICQKALTRSRDARFSNASELAEALDAWLNNHETSEPRSALARWFEENAADLAVSSGEVTQARIATQSVSRPIRAEQTAATPSLNSAETVTTNSRPEARLPSRLPLAPDPEATRRLAARSTSGENVSAADASAEGDTAAGRASERGAHPDGDTVEPERPAGLQAMVPGEGESTSGDDGGAAITERMPTSRPYDQTLDGSPDATHQNLSAPFRSRRPLQIAAAAALLLAVGAGVALSQRSGGSPALSDAGPAALQTLPSDPLPPPPPPSPKASLESVVIQTMPNGASLFDEDNKFLGSAPQTLEHAPGTFKVSAQFSDQRITEAVTLNKGEPRVVTIVAKVPLKIVVGNTRATVKVEGRNKGETPAEFPAFLEPGKPVKILLLAPGFEAKELEVTARPGEPVEISETLKRAAGPPPPPPPPPVAYGLLHVRTSGVEITQGRLDGEKLPELPFRDHRTKAGRRVLTLLNPVEKVSESFTVTVPPDGEVLVIIEFEKKADRWKAKKPTIK